MTSLHEIEGVCTSCAEGCGLCTRVEQGTVTQLEYMQNHPVNGGALCRKGNQVIDSIYHPGRIYSPLAKKEDGSFQAISWNEAIAAAASHLKKTASKHGADALGFLTSTTCTNEENYLFQKLARIAGTNSVDCTSHYGANSSIPDLLPSLGHAAVTNSFSDLSNAECIIISGSNFIENHPMVSRWIFEAQSKGATVICIDHRVPPSLLFCDHFLQINPGTQAIFIDGMIVHILEKQLFNTEFLENFTSGFKPFQKAMAKQSLKNCEKLSGIPVSRIKEVAERYASASASALVQSADSSSAYGRHTATVRNLANLALLCGQIGRPGTGIFPLAQACNTQGSIDMGVSPHLLPGQVSLKDQTQRIRLAKLWQVKALPSKEGLSFPGMLSSSKNRRVRALYVMEADPLVNKLLAEQTGKSRSGLEFLLVQDCTLTETARRADIVLPAPSWAEKTGTYTSGERRVQWQSRIINPQQHIIPNWQVICSIAEKMGYKKQFSFSNPEAVLKEINKTVVPYTGISPARVKKMQGIIHPCPTSNHPGTPILYTERFATPDGRGTFIPVSYDRLAEKPTKKHPFFLSFGNSSTTMLAPLSRDGGQSAVSGEVSSPLLVEIHPKDAKKIPVHNHGEVKIITRRGSTTAAVLITERVLPGVVFVPFLPAGTLRPFSSSDPRAIIPELDAATCDIKKSGGEKR